jgi:hypothetical protein
MEKVERGVGAKIVVEAVAYATAEACSAAEIETVVTEGPSIPSTPGNWL